MCREDIFVNKMFLNGNKSVLNFIKTVIKVIYVFTKKPQWTNKYSLKEILIMLSDKDKKQWPASSVSNPVCKICDFKFVRKVSPEPQTYQIKAKRADLVQICLFSNERTPSQSTDV